MPTTTVEVQELLIRLDELVSLANAGTEIIVTQDSIPRARLTPLPASRRVPGLHAGAIAVNDDFDVPLSDEFWLGTP